jgi:DNA-binding CsgD family transcriptional regulator/PAS domain-containing protein
MGAQLEPGVVRGSESVIQDDELIRTEFYNDFLAPQRYFHSFGAAITREENVTAYITSVRGRKAGYFNAAEQELCRELIPHLQAALRVRHHFAGLEAQVKHLSAALDHLTQGIVITDAAGRICFMNRSAEATLGARNGIWIAAGGLRASRAEETLRLRQLLKEAAGGVTTNGTHAGGVMQISRPGKLPLKISISPLADSAYGSPHQAAAILLIAAPGSANALDARPLQQLFGFTPAEARLTAALVGGKSVREFTEEAGVSLNTARTHLKSLFTKAGVSRQSALVREVLATMEQLNRYL